MKFWADKRLKGFISKHNKLRTSEGCTPCKHYFLQHKTPFLKQLSKFQLLGWFSARVAKTSRHIYLYKIHLLIDEEPYRHERRDQANTASHRGL